MLSPGWEALELFRDGEGPSRMRLTGPTRSQSDQIGTALWTLVIIKELTSLEPPGKPHITIY